MPVRDLHPRLVIHRGFTLVELIVVIVVLAVLGGVAISKYHDASKKAAAAAVRAHVRYLSNGCLQWERDSVHSDPDELTGYSSDDFAASPLVQYLDDHAFNAFNSRWVYYYYAQNNGNFSTIYGQSIPTVATTTAEADQLMTSWAGQSQWAGGTLSSGYAVRDQSPQWHWYLTVQKSGSTFYTSIQHAWYHGW